MSKKSKSLKKLTAKSTTSEELPLEAVEPEVNQDQDEPAEVTFSDPEDSVPMTDEQRKAFEEDQGGAKVIEPEHPLDTMSPEEARLQPERFYSDGRRMFTAHKEDADDRTRKTLLDNNGLTLALAVEIKSRLYGVDEAGKTKLPHHAQFVLRCQCGKLLTYCDEIPVHQDNRLRIWECQDCHFTIPFKDGVRREYDRQYLRSIDEEIQAELKKVRLPEIDALRAAKGQKPSR